MYGYWKAMEKELNMEKGHEIWFQQLLQKPWVRERKNFRYHYNDTSYEINGD